MAVTLVSAQQHLAAWEAASLALANGQTFSMGGRTLSRSNAAEVREMIEYWSRIVASLQEAARTGKKSRAGFALARFV